VTLKRQTIARHILNIVEHVVPSVQDVPDGLARPYPQSTERYMLVSSIAYTYMASDNTWGHVLKDKWGRASRDAKRCLGHDRCFTMTVRFASAN